MLQINFGGKYNMNGHYFCLNNKIKLKFKLDLYTFIIILTKYTKYEKIFSYLKEVDLW